MLSDLERTLYDEKFLTFNLGGANLTDAATIQACWRSSITGHITEVSCGYGTETGTTPSITTCGIYRGATAIVAVGTIDTAATPVSSGAVAAYIDRGEVLTLQMIANHASDNVFLGLTVLVRMRVALSTT